jgi:hypothetical protein
LLNIASTFQTVFHLALTTSTNTFKLAIHFYMEMPQSLTTPTSNQQDELVVNLDDCSLELDVLTIPSQTQGVTELGDLLSLPRLPTRRKNDKEPLVDYSNSHVVALDQYMTVLRHKTLEKKIVDKIKK